MLGAVLGLAACGLAAGLLPGISTYANSALGRAVGLRATDRLFAATERFVGLRYFEDPDFLDRLRLGQQATLTCHGLLGSAFESARSTLTLAGFVGALIVINPWMSGDRAGHARADARRTTAAGQAANGDDVADQPRAAPRVLLQPAADRRGGRQGDQALRRRRVPARAHGARAGLVNTAQRRMDLRELT